MTSNLRRRVCIDVILADPHLRRKLLVQANMALQHREGIMTTKEQAEKAYDKVKKENQDEQ